MKIKAVKTAIAKGKGDINDFILHGLENAKKSFEISSLADVLEGSVLIVSAKIISILQGNMVNLDEISFQTLVEREADNVLDDVDGCFLTQKYGIIIPNAGVDRSNVPQGYVIPWPNNPEEVAGELRNLLSEKFGVDRLGVVIADSRITPGRKGTTGVALAWSGFEGVEDERGKEDLFGDTLKLAQKATADNLVSAALLVMGEAKECTPLALIEHAPVQFGDILGSRAAVIDPDEDLFRTYVNRP